MIIELSIVPLGRGPSLSSDLAGILTLIDESGLPYKLTPMGTCIEGEWDQVMELVKRCHMKMTEIAPRTITTIKIDDYKGKKDQLHGKIESVERAAKRKFKT